MVLFIIAHIIYFGYMGKKLFMGTIEGSQYFPNFGESCFNLLVLLTTANFPDVMLPAYEQ